MVLQHFAAAPLSLSQDADCLRLDTLFDGPLFWDAEAGEGRTVHQAAFGHGCDTTGTSSGSPVLDRATYQVQGLHQQGFRESDAPENRALRAALIAEFLAEQGLVEPPRTTAYHEEGDPR